MISIDERTEGPETGSDADNAGAPTKPGNAKASNEIFEWIKALAIAGLLVFVIRWFLVSPFIVDGPSMQPNFKDRERIIVNKIIYDIRKPKRGEVIVFHVPEEGRDFIKRVIGVPGDTVKVAGDTIYINGQPIEESYLEEAYETEHAQNQLYNRDKPNSNFPNNSYPDGKVPEGTLFVMGDNRSNSEDSRMIGYIPMDRIVGRADLVFWPLGDFHFVKH
ncbi:signal peptidase I [Cohnella sp. GCM10027633]|uniref:signal peptidase I n=1 Tax=unclassified Cohnella TaxID=2636738 RepID=UPI00363C9B98